MVNLTEIIALILLINFITAVAFYHDKKAAKNNGWRVSEASLLLLCLLGGSPAAYLMQKKLRHKTKKRSFVWRYHTIVIIQIIIITMAYYNGFNVS